MIDKARHADVWSFLLQKLNAGIPSALLLVLESRGSSPGRQGFKMAVSLDSDMTGSIGGGIMEHKLVELTVTVLDNGVYDPVLKKQVHQAESPKDRSGMICSGDQTVVIYPLPENFKSVLLEILGALANSEGAFLSGTESGISFRKGKNTGKRFDLNIHSDKKWAYLENLKEQDVVHIIGGGHVGKALSCQMAFLGFYVKIYDNRPDLNTLATNEFADEKIIIGYEKIDEVLNSNHNDYVVIMTFGYRDDKLVLKQLLEKDFRYIGMMGSKAKVEQLLAELVNEGCKKEFLKKVKTPIGLPISSQTPEEIAVSIAAEIVKIKNNL